MKELSEEKEENTERVEKNLFFDNTLFAGIIERLDPSAIVVSVSYLRFLIEGSDNICRDGISGLLC